MALSSLLEVKVVVAVGDGSRCYFLEYLLAFPSKMTKVLISSERSFVLMAFKS